MTPIPTEPRDEDLVRQERELERWLGTLAPIEPPPGFAAAVMRRVGEIRPAPARGRFVGWVTALGAPPVLRYAAAVAGGAALGAMVMVLAGRGPTAGEGTAATALPREGIAAASVLARADLSAGGVAGHIVVRQAGDRVVAEMTLDSLEALEVELSFDPAFLEAVGFEGGPPGRGVSLGEGRLSLAHRGEGQYRLLLAPKGTGPGVLRVRIEGRGVRLDRDLAWFFEKG